VRELAEQRDARQAAQLEQGRAHAALEGVERLRTQLEKDLAPQGQLTAASACASRARDRGV
jgi:hypothetical protein